MKDYKVDERPGSQYSFNFDNDENPTHMIITRRTDDE